MNVGEADEKIPDGNAAGTEGEVGEDEEGENNEEEEELDKEIEEEIDDGELNKLLVPRLRLSKKQKDDIYEAFRLLDDIGNGLIDASKFKIVLYALGYEVTPEELKSIIAEVSETPYGKLSLGGFFKLIMNKCDAKDSEIDMMKSFMGFDLQETGEVSCEDMIKVAQLIEDESNEEEIMEMFQEADENGEGSFSLNNFIRVMNQCVPLRIEKEYE